MISDAEREQVWMDVIRHSQQYMRKANISDMSNTWEDAISHVMLSLGNKLEDMDSLDGYTGGYWYSFAIGRTIDSIRKTCRRHRIAPMDAYDPQETMLVSHDDGEYYSMIHQTDD